MRKTDFQHFLFLFADLKQCKINILFLARLMKMQIVNMTSSDDVLRKIAIVSLIFKGLWLF